MCFSAFSVRRESSGAWPTVSVQLVSGILTFNYWRTNDFTGQVFFMAEGLLRHRDNSTLEGPPPNSFLPTENDLHWWDGEHGRPGTQEARRIWVRVCIPPPLGAGHKQSVFVCWGTHNKILQPWMLEQQEFLISQSWRLGSESPAGLVSPVALSPWLTDVSPLVTPSHSQPIMHGLPNISLCILNSS